MWKEITQTEFYRIKKTHPVELTSCNESEWSDFQEIVFTEMDTYDAILCKTVQSHYNEVEDYPPTIRYYKWEN